ncbi:DUF2442 domain-containing protein [Dyadobacter subterraneus]|uniref:DUF2442 domain-containing protein n=1 Tax=Dyadobacter subterraneus TaxID=2773304 RepID=A0ABR9WLI2_9BACT|nr:DUF2442 domain-containing protein [Dyadobacter subterraneus]MBE9466342.1 DUF2442 domain-containing protein [Dyadobacter subterraneus]
MLYYIEKIVSIHAYTISCLFNTGEVRDVDFTDIIEKYKKINDGLISELVDEEFFKSVQLDSYGTLQWNNGVDFDPDNLYKRSKKQIVTIQ